jgi:hypothetical protein
VEPKEGFDEEANEAAVWASESDEATGSASAWASRESRRDLLMKSSSVRRDSEGIGGRVETIEEARVGDETMGLYDDVGRCMGVASLKHQQSAGV